MKFYVSHGYSLLEILIVLAITGILAASGIPLYTHHYLAVHRLATIGVLSNLTVAMEVYSLAHQSYQGATLENLAVPTGAIKTYYQLSIQVTEDDYQLIATPINKQSEDALCGILSINAAGEKQITGTGGIKDCW